MEINQQVLQEKWAPVLDSQEAGSIADSSKTSLTAVVLENQEIAVGRSSRLYNNSIWLRRRQLGSSTNLFSETCYS